MPTIVEALNLKGSPFENYVAEQEPAIVDYAVKPPYFEALSARSKNRSSFILFGERGAGKSATRLTVFQEIWSERGKGGNVPFCINLTDFSFATSGRNVIVNEEKFIQEVAFLCIEGLLTWLSTLEEADRKVYLEALDENEKSLCYRLLRDFYASQSNNKRIRSAREAMTLLSQTSIAKSKLWIEKKWEPISNMIANISEILASKALNAKAEINKDISSALNSKKDQEHIDAILTLNQLVELVAIFGFNGLVILIDKVDETEATNNSSDKTAELIYPLLAKVQLLEVKNFSWIFFLWQSIRNNFEGDQFPVRLDKIGHATVSWDDAFFIEMLDRRMQYFSNNRYGFSGLFEKDINIPLIQKELIKISMRSPRELIRLVDVIIREHDRKYSSEENISLLTNNSVENGIDTYVKDRISSIYGERILAQIFRLKRTTFSNKDVQNTFRVGAQSARTRIQSWENAGIVKYNGTRAAEGALGGKPANEYIILDARIERIMMRDLISYDQEPIPEIGIDTIEEKDD